MSCSRKKAKERDFVRLSKRLGHRYALRLPLSHEFRFVERIQVENNSYILQKARNNSQDGPRVFQLVLEELRCTRSYPYILATSNAKTASEQSIQRFQRDVQTKDLLVHYWK